MDDTGSSAAKIIPKQQTNKKYCTNNETKKGNKHRDPGIGLVPLLSGERQTRRTVIYSRYTLSSKKWGVQDNMHSLQIYSPTIFKHQTIYLSPLYAKLAVLVVPQLETLIKKGVTEKDGKVTLELDRFEEIVFKEKAKQ